MASEVAQKVVRPLLSTNKAEARRRVLNLYKAWFRQVPYIVKDFDIPKSEQQCREKLRELFLKNRNVTDIRVIDLLVIKGQMELKETVNMWKQKGNIMSYWADFLSKFFTGQMELKETVNMWKQKGNIMSYWAPTQEPKPKDFLSKFFNGSD